jgi:hypothetical protein
MDSYDEYARRARIMTEVHALSDRDNEENIAASTVGSRNIKQGGRDGSDNDGGKIGGQLQSTSSSSSTVIESNVTDDAKENQSAIQKKKETKKKNLKRL